MKNLAGSLKSVSVSLLCFAALLSYMSTTALQIKGEEQGALSWGQAHWVAAPEFQPVSYFLGHLVLSNKARKALLKVAASDNFEVYINGIKIVSKHAPSVNPLWVGSVENVLKQGVNTIAVRVEKKVWEGDPQLLLSLMAQDYNGVKRTLFTDATWQVSSVPSNAFSKAIHWANPSFDASQWQRVRLLEGGDRPKSASSLIFGTDEWESLDQFHPVWHAFLDQSQAHFKVTTPLSRTDLRNAWLMMRCEGSYKVSINSRRVGDHRGGADQVTLINVYQYLLANKENTLEVFADCENRNGISLQFMAKKSSGGVVAIPGAEWFVDRLSVEVPRQPMTQHAYYLLMPEAEDESQTSSRRLVFDSDSVVVVDHINYVAAGIRWLQGLLLWGSLAAVSVLIVFSVSRDDSAVRQSINIVLSLITLLAGLSCLMTLDVRVAAGDVFNLYVVAFIVLTLFLSEFILVIQLRAPRGLGVSVARELDCDASLEETSNE